MLFDPQGDLPVRQHSRRGLGADVGAAHQAPGEKERGDHRAQTSVPLITAAGNDQERDTATTAVWNVAAITSDLLYICAGGTRYTEAAQGDCG